MRIILYSVISALTISINSLNAQGLSPKQGGHCFTMNIADYMAKTFDLNDVASLQYQNTSKEAYIIVIHDSKSELEHAGMKFLTAKEFLIDFTKDFKKDVKKRKLGDISEFVSNDNGHAQVELTWVEDDLDFYMLITGVETKSTFYKILCWTIKDNKAQLYTDFIEMSKSIKD